MDKTLRTIREEIRKNREGNIPALTLVIDTNILADHAWARDSNVVYLIEEIVPDHREFLIVVPHICEVEFKLITKEEVNGWKKLQEEISDFDVERVLEGLREADVEVHFDSGKCLRRVKEVLERER